jgi:predicted membrane protein
MYVMKYRLLNLVLSKFNLQTLSVSVDFTTARSVKFKIQHFVYKLYAELEVYLHVFLTTALQEVCE